MSRVKNTIFNFKQFSIRQDQTAMKVCTDACILGAYTDIKEVNQILDIGTGTGLLALMLAQRTKAEIHAVEIDESAYQQAFENVTDSPFSSQIKVFNTPIQQFCPPSVLSNTYDLIICNPPFYQNDLRSPQKQRNVALHAQTLTLDELLDSAKKLLKETGEFVVLLPPFEMQALTEKAIICQLFPSKILIIRNFEDSAIFRMICTFSFKKPEPLTDTLIIYDESRSYTSAFRELLKAYYLIF